MKGALDFLWSKVSPISQSLILPGSIVARGLNIIVHIAECDMRVNSFPAKVRLP